MFGKSTTSLATGLVTSLLAAAIAVPGTAAQAAQPGGAQLAEHVPAYRFIAGRDCIYRGVQVTHRSVRHFALIAGYRDIGNIRFVPRQYGRELLCGYYRADATLAGRPFVIYADARNGRIVGRVEVARYGHGTYQNLSTAEVRTILLNHGYHGIRNIRYVQRDGLDLHVARANWRGWVVRLWVADVSGRVVDRQRLRRLGGTFGRPDLSQKQLRELLRSRGYRDIRGVGSEATGHDFVAYIGNVAYRIRVSATTGEIESQYRLR